MAKYDPTVSLEKSSIEAPDYARFVTRPAAEFEPIKTDVDLIRGSTEGHVFDLDEISRIAKFYGDVNRLLFDEGTEEFPVLIQKDAHSDREEEARDEILHMLGLLLNTDIEGALNSTQEVKTGVLPDFYREMFDFPEQNEDDENSEMSISNLRFSIPENPDLSFLLHELEVDVDEMYDDGVWHKTYRFLGLFTDEHSDV